MELAGPNAKDPALADDIKTYVSVGVPNARQVGIAFPGTFMLDRDGRVKSRFFEDFYIERNTVSSILARVAAKGDVVAGTQVSTALALTGLFAAEDVFAAAVAGGALSVDAAAGSDTPFDARIHELLYA